MRSPLFAASFVAVVCAAVGCGSPFVKGWRPDATADERTPEQRCEARDGYTWLNDKCEKDSDLHLTDVSTKQQCDQIKDAGWLGDKCRRYAELDQTLCAGVKDWAWGQKDGKGACMPAAEQQCTADAKRVYVGGRCLDRPSLALEGGALTQSVAAGSSMLPLTVKIDQGVQADLKNATCPGFFKIDAGKVTSGVAELKDAAAATCEVDVVARAGAAESLPAHVSVQIAQGFLGYCNTLKTNVPDDSRELWHTIVTLKRALKKPDCGEAATALADIVDLEIRDVQINDLRPLASARSLVWLTIEGRVKDLSPLAGLPKLESVEILGNPRPDNCPTGDDVAPGVRNYCRAFGAGK